LIIKSTGIITVDGIEGLLYEMRKHQIYIILIEITLLFSDLFVTAPTMTATILSGYFLGWPLSILTSLSGVYLASISGYVISRAYGYQ